MKVSYSFLTIGKTKEVSSESSDFKRYVGIGSSFVLAVNPDKKTLDELTGYESQSDPEYIGSDDNGQYARVTFIVRTDPNVNNGIEITNRVMFTLRNTPAYNRDKTKVQVIDDYGNTTWTSVDDAKAGKKILTAAGNPARIADKYRMARVGEADLVAFLKIYLGVGDVFNYANGSWIIKENTADYLFKLEKINDYFKGDFSELKEALALQPNSKIKLLYGVRTTDDGKQYQSVATRSELMLRNNANSNALARLEKALADAKAAGSYATTEYKVQDLQEYVVEPTNLSQPQDNPFSAGTDTDMPWD